MENERIVFMTATYDRPEHLKRLAASIAKEKQPEDLWVVFDDCSPETAENIVEVVELVDYMSRSEMRRGKKEYWRTVREQMKWLRENRDRWDVCVFVPDDAVISEGGRERILADLGSRPILSLHNDQPARLHKDNWGRVPVEKRKFWHDGFIDMMFAARSSWFEAMEWTVLQVRRPWEQQPKLGSGVGSQLTKRTRQAGIDILIGKGDYLTRDFETPSQMNP